MVDAYTILVACNSFSYIIFTFTVGMFDTFSFRCCDSFLSPSVSVAAGLHNNFLLSHCLLVTLIACTLFFSVVYCNRNSIFIRSDGKLDIPVHLFYRAWSRQVCIRCGSSIGTSIYSASACSKATFTIPILEWVHDMHIVKVDNERWW